MSIWTWVRESVSIYLTDCVSVFWHDCMSVQFLIAWLYTCISVGRELYDHVFMYVFDYNTGASPTQFRVRSCNKHLLLHHTLAINISAPSHMYLVMSVGDIVMYTTRRQVVHHHSLIYTCILLFYFHKYSSVMSSNKRDYWRNLDQHPWTVKSSYSVWVEPGQTTNEVTGSGANILTSSRNWRKQSNIKCK